MATNPWLTPAAEPDAPAQSTDEPEKPHATGARWPEPGLRAVDTVDRLPRRDVPPGSGLWVLGVHGGAGETSLATWLEGASECGHAWPIQDGQPARVLLVARTHAAGLEAARRAATEWGGATVPVGVQGLVLLGDAPGALPHLLRAQVRQLSGAVPATWALPYCPSMRLAATVPPEPPPPVARVLRAISRSIITTEGTS